MRKPLVALGSVLLLSGCGATDPEWPTETAEVRYSDARVSYTFTTQVADFALTSARAAFPDLAFELNYIASSDDTWGECAAEVPSDLDIPEHNGWHANRELDVVPAQGTVELVMPIADALIADGWRLTTEDLDDALRPRVVLSKDAFDIQILATQPEQVAAGNRARLRIGAGSPCLESPDDLADFDPDDPDAYFGPGSAPTVGPYDPPPTLSWAEMGRG